TAVYDFALLGFCLNVTITRNVVHVFLHVPQARSTSRHLNHYFWRPCRHSGHLGHVCPPSLFTRCVSKRIFHTSGIVFFRQSWWFYNNAYRYINAHHLTLILL